MEVAIGTINTCLNVYFGFLTSIQGLEYREFSSLIDISKYCNLDGVVFEDFQQHKFGLKETDVNANSTNIKTSDSE